MFRMVVGHSDEVDAERAVPSIVAQSSQQLNGETPAGGLLFSTFDTDAETLAAGLADAYPDAEIIGSTTMGEMSSVLGFQEDSAVLALFVSDSVDITAGLGTDVTTDPSAAVRRAVAEARAKTNQEPALCVTTPSVRGLPRKILADLREELGEGVTMVGGGAAGLSLGEDAQRGRQFYNGRVFEDAIPILLFSGALIHSLGVDAGWRPVGKSGRVTRATENVVYEIDGEPAIRFYERYLGPGAQPTSANPLAVFDEGSDRFYLRVAFADQEHPGALAPPTGGIPEGATVQLSVAMTDEIFDGTRSAFERAIKGYPEGATPEAALLFACAVRKAMLGTRTGRELEIARTELGASLPIAGAYCLGEIAPLEARSPTRFHNETMVAVLLGTE